MNNGKNGYRRLFVNNTAWMVAQKIFSMLVSLIVGALSARYLGPSNYGVLNYGSSIISFFSVICCLGLDSILVVEMARTPEKQGSYIGTALFLRLIVSLISMLCIWGIISTIEPDNNIVQVVTLLQALVLVFNSYEVFLYWFQLKLAMKYIAISSMVGITITAIWRIWLLMSGKSIEYFALSTSMGSVITGLIVVIFFLKHKDFRLSFSLKDGSTILNLGKHFVISGLAIALYSQLDKIMLGKMIGPEEVGFYSAAATIANMWEFVPVAIINSARSVLVRQMKENRNKYIENYKILLLCISLMGVVVGIGILLFGGLAIRILYGEQFSSAVPIVNILIWATSFAMIGSARSIWIVSERKNKYVKYYVFVGAVVNAILNALIIPFWGGVGAAITTLISQIVVAIIAPMMFSETREFCYIYIGALKKLKNIKELVNLLVKKKES